MRKKRMAEIRSMFKPFFQYMQAVLAVDPEFGLSYENVKYYDVEEFENLCRIVSNITEAANTTDAVREALRIAAETAQDEEGI